MTTITSAKHTAVGTIVKGYNKSVITIVLQLLIRTISANYIHKANGFIVMLQSITNCTFLQKALKLNFRDSK